MNKKEIINKIIEIQNNVIDNLKESAIDYKSASNIDENDNIDPEDFSHQEEAKDMQLRYEQMTIQAKNNLEVLESYINKNCSTIEAGALVETESLFLFIGISISQFTFNGKNVITFSEQAPIFSMLKEKSIGQKIAIGMIENTILSIS